MKRPLLSIVVPAHNEEDSIVPLRDAVFQALSATSVEIEIIYVDDGSRDRTRERLILMAQQDPRVRMISFTRNFGHQAALMAGLETARGDAIVTMDCDLQHPPTLLPQMVEAWQKGYKVVQTVREETRDAGRGKRFTSRAFYRLMQALSDTPITPGAADFQLLDRAALRDLLSLRDSRPFLRGMVSWIGYSRIAVPYVANARQHGVSSYTWRTMFLLAVDAITAFSTRPLRLAFYAALCSSLAMLLYLAFIVVKFMENEVVQGWTSLAVVILLLGTIQLITLGIMGEYIGRIYEQVRNRPRYLVEYRSPAPESAESDPGNRLAAAPSEVPSAL